MRMRRPYKLAAGAAAIALLATACGGDDDPDDVGDDDAAGPTGSVVVGGCNPQNPLIPAMTNETCGGNPLDAIFSKLTRYDPDTAEPFNEIAESFESDDNITWTVTLKEGWTFHDGTPILAHNFVDAWNWGAYGPNATLSSYFYGAFGLGISGAGEIGGLNLGGEDLDANGDGEVTEDEAPVSEMSGLEVVDDLTFTITLDNPRPDLPTVVGYTAFAPLPDVFFDDPEAFGNDPIGSGPFDLVEWAQEEEIVLTAYDGYMGEDKPEVADVTFRIYQDQDAAYADLLADDVDVQTQLPTSVLAGEQYAADLGERFIERETGVIQTITANGNVDAALADVDVRKAISMAIDRQLIIDTIFEGTRSAATGWVAPVVNGYKADQCGEACVYDPEAAKALLETTDFEGPLTLSYNADGDHQAWTEATCTSIANALDIECIATPEVDFATFRTKITEREMTGLFRTGWQMDYPTIENFLGPLYATGAGSNDGDYSNPAFDDLLNQASSTTDADEAIALYQEAEALLADDLPSIPMWYGQTIAGYSNNVENVKITPFQTLDILSITTAS
jgi:oligopeptide transport system substrate-binding protein